MSKLIWLCSLVSMSLLFFWVYLLLYPGPAYFQNWPSHDRHHHRYSYFQTLGRCYHFPEVGFSVRPSLLVDDLDVLVGVVERNDLLCNVSGVGDWLNSIFSNASCGVSSHGILTWGMLDQVVEVFVLLPLVLLLELVSWWMRLMTSPSVITYFNSMIWWLPSSSLNTPVH